LNPSGKLLDDGEFYVALNENQAPDIASGFLERRCFVSPSAPNGFECIGSFAMLGDGTWEAKITKVYNPLDDSDCELVATGVQRLDAVIALWLSRREAYLGYHSL